MRRPIRLTASERSVNSVFSFNVWFPVQGEEPIRITRCLTDLPVIVVRVKHTQRNFDTCNVGWSRLLHIHILHPSTLAFVRDSGNATRKTSALLTLPRARGNISYRAPY